MTVNVCGNAPGGQAGQSTSRRRGQASCAGKRAAARAPARKHAYCLCLAPERLRHGHRAALMLRASHAGRRMKRLAARQHSQHLAPDSGRQRSRRAGTLQGHERTLAHAARRARQSACPDPGAARHRTRVRVCTGQQYRVGERTDGQKRDQRENLREDAHRPPPRTQAAQQAAELGHRSRGLLQRRTLFPGPPEAVV